VFSPSAEVKVLAKPVAGKQRVNISLLKPQRRGDAEKILFYFQ
jgi:hypothetical protein